jgi:hypothetical protein
MEKNCVCVFFYFIIIIINYIKKMKSFVQLKFFLKLFFYIYVYMYIYVIQFDLFSYYITLLKKKKTKNDFL